MYKKGNDAVDYDFLTRCLVMLIAAATNKTD